MVGGKRREICKKQTCQLSRLWNFPFRYLCLNFDLSSLYQAVNGFHVNNLFSCVEAIFCGFIGVAECQI